MKKTVKGNSKSKCIFLLANLLVTLCVYGPNIPSGSFTYAPKVPDEIKLKFGTKDIKWNE